MAKPYLIIVFSMLLGSSYNFVAAQTSKITDPGIIQLTKRHTQPKPDVFKELTAQDRKNYLLTIDQSKIGKPHDKVFNVPVKLSNLSNDTLRYLSMTCSWEVFFSINNKKLNFSGWVCDSNFPIDKLVSPHKSVTYNIPVLTDGPIRDNKFRIGINLFIINRQSRNFILYSAMRSFDFKTKNLIWSNEVQLPK